MDTREMLINGILNPKDKLTKLIFRIYERMYECAGANFIELVKNGELIDEGISIPFNDYEISKDDFDRILNEELFRKHKRTKTLVRNSIYLGSGPKIKYNFDEKK